MVFTCARRCNRKLHFVDLTSQQKVAAEADLVRVWPTTTEQGEQAAVAKGGVFSGVFGAFTFGENSPGRAHSAARSCATASNEKTHPCATAHRAWDAGNSPQKKATSEVRKKNLNPEWGYTVECEVQAPQSSVIELKIWDKDLATSDSMGAVVLKDLPRGESPVAEWYDVEKTKDCKDASGRLYCGAAWSKPERPPTPPSQTLRRHLEVLVLKDNPDLGDRGCAALAKASTVGVPHHAETRESTSRATAYSCGRAMREADTKARTTIWKDGDGGIDPPPRLRGARDADVHGGPR